MAIKDVGARSVMAMRRLASMVNWAKNARINSSGYSPAQWAIGRELWTKNRVENWSCQITHLSWVDECHGCGLRDVRC